MNSIPDSLVRQLRRTCLGALLVGLATAAATPCLAQVPIIQPGAPGEPARELSADEAIEIADTSYSPDDALFMQDMIRIITRPSRWAHWWPTAPTGPS